MKPYISLNTKYDTKGKISLFYIISQVFILIKMSINTCEIWYVVKQFKMPISKDIIALVTDERTRNIISSSKQF